jgi:hypothetical protein
MSPPLGKTKSIDLVPISIPSPEGDRDRDNNVDLLDDRDRFQSQKHRLYLKFLYKLRLWIMSRELIILTDCLDTFIFVFLDTNCVRTRL